IAPERMRMKKFLAELDRLQEFVPINFLAVDPVKDGASKNKTYREILTKHLPKALKQSSLPAVVSHFNARKEKALGIVFCIYADPHGKHSIWDGTAHYLFETMRIREPHEVFDSQRGSIDMFNLNALSRGEVRAFSSN